MISEKCLLVNFGGPRSLTEIEPFLISLLTDRDVISSQMPDWLHNFFFTRVAKKRVKKITQDYQLIGGKSPIYEDTESVASALKNTSGGTFLTFHRYLTSTHAAFLANFAKNTSESIIVLPLFPQFSFSTQGSIARWFSKHLPHLNIKWIKSYCDHPAYIRAMVSLIRDFLKTHQLFESETVLLFSAHGLPQSYIDQGDCYQIECEKSFRCISHYFPHASAHLSYQSKFGKGEWLKPYTDEWCNALQPNPSQKQVVVIPLSFTSDHIETLFEIEHLYLNLIRQRGIAAYRLPALNLRPDWIAALAEILQTSPTVPNDYLIKK